MLPYVVFLLVMFGNGFCSNHSTHKNFETMEYHITLHKYPYENHTVLTEDGYYLTLSHIPVSLNKTCDKIKGTVMLYHGMVNNGIVFFYNGPNSSMGFALSDKCYDVWIPNTRGTRYSNRHVNLTTHDRAFWNFSYDELAKYDMKANIDYVVNVTGSSKIQYVGFSQGATQILMFLCKNPEYEKYMASLQLIAPVAYFENFTVPEFLPKEVLYTLSKTATGLLSRSLPDSEYLGHELLAKVCENQDGVALCSLIISANSSPTKTEQEKNLKWAHNFPERISLRMLAHYAQFYMSKIFQMYDYGPAQNLQRYSTEKPPRYAIENIKLPIHLYHAVADTWCTKEGVNILAKQISNLRLKYFIEDSLWGHEDFFANVRNGSASYRQKLLESIELYS